MSAEVEKKTGDGWKKVLHILPATALLLASLGGLGWLIWLFHSVAFLPLWLAGTLRVLCVAAMLFCIAFYRCYLSSRH